MSELKKKAIGILAIAGVEPYQEKPGEEYMSPEQTEHFTKILAAWRLFSRFTKCTKNDRCW